MEVTYVKGRVFASSCTLRLRLYDRSSMLRLRIRRTHAEPELLPLGPYQDNVPQRPHMLSARFVVMRTYQYS